MAFTIPAKSRELIPLGFAMELPKGFEAVVRPRSGLSLDGIDVAIGTIDSNYRGEVKACVINNTDGNFEISAGDRICQLAVREIPIVTLEVVAELSDTERGSNGFGSSGI
jgi:dUTP pyrophosphatase